MPPALYTHPCYPSLTHETPRITGLIFESIYAKRASRSNTKARIYNRNLEPSLAEVKEQYEHKSGESVDAEVDSDGTLFGTAVPTMQTEHA